MEVVQCVISSPSRYYLVDIVIPGAVRYNYFVFPFLQLLVVTGYSFYSFV